MNAVVSKLVEIFARCKVSEVAGDKEYQALCKAHDGKQRFHAQRALVESLKQKLEKRLEAQSSDAAEVAEALIYLNKVSRGGDEKKSEACLELIKRAYRPSWSPGQIQHFDHYAEALKHYDFFLSFTTKNTDTNADNVVNTHHKSFIKYNLGEARLVSPDEWRQKNLLAEAIHHLLVRGGKLNGFFYPDREGDNTFVMEKLDQAARNSFVFIQIVHNAIFEFRQPNCCHLEYRSAKEAMREEERLKRFRVVLAERSQEELTAEVDIPDPYDKWYEEVVKKDKIILEFSEEYDLRKILAINEKLDKELVKKVHDVKWSLIQAVPDA